MPLLSPAPLLACIPAATPRPSLTTHRAPCCLQVGEAEKELGGANGTNPFAQLVDEAEGLDKIEDLQVGPMCWQCPAACVVVVGKEGGKGMHEAEGLHKAEDLQGAGRGLRLRRRGGCVHVVWWRPQVSTPGTHHPRTTPTPPSS